MLNDQPGLHQHIERHKNGTIRASGNTLEGLPDGYWEWYRLDGSKMRSGHFQLGLPVGEWITYDKAGNVYKVTTKDGKTQDSAA